MLRRLGPRAAADRAAGRGGRRRRLAAHALRTERDRRIEPLPAPAAFAGELRPYQERGLSWLAFLSRLGLGACLADDMGLGKTVQLLALLLASASAAEPAARRCWSARRRWSATGSGRPSASPRACGCTCTTARDRLDRRGFAAAARARPRAHHLRARRRAITDACRSVAWDRVVLDEAQNIKNPRRQADPSRSARSPRAPPDRADRHAGREPARRAVVDHGLPEPRPARLGHDASASGSRCRSSGTATTAAAARLRQVDRPVRAAPAQDRPDDHRRPAREARDEGRTATSRASRPRSTRRSSTSMLDAAPRRPRGSSGAGIVLAALTKLKQVCNHPAHLLERRVARCPGARASWPALEEMLDEALAAGDKALVLHPVRRDRAAARGRTCQERLGHEVLFLHGGTAEAARDAMVDRFQDDRAARRSSCCR